jgi:hypothetical protein
MFGLTLKKSKNSLKIREMINQKQINQWSKLYGRQITEEKDRGRYGDIRDSL